MEAVFLNADMGGATMYIKVPEAMILCGLITREEAKTVAFRLDKSVYGNVDHFFLTFKKIMLARWHWLGSLERMRVWRRHLDI